MITGLRLTKDERLGIKCSMLHLGYPARQDKNKRTEKTTTENVASGKLSCQCMETTPVI
ncbi:hypothetical protein GbCGDNIH3_7168 [Granulibacter bethesdensis]|uniref:Uncharacterized protein n=1 Tax=Granulibacter bethesdensis TaxID=364410 RepID=A0AAN0RCS9_9PROT|nr:hypothetical protein GbCGDNIH3_7168 [Granulibacter bethesdensis]